MSVVFGLGTRLRVRMHTNFKNGVLHNEQQPQRVVNTVVSLKSHHCNVYEFRIHRSAAQLMHGSQWYRDACDLF